MRITNNLIAGELKEGSLKQTTTTPINNEEITQVNALSEDEMVQVFQVAKRIETIKVKKDFYELTRLGDYIKNHYDDFLTQIMDDAAFTKKDAEDLVNCTIEFCNDYGKHINQIGNQELITDFSFKEGSAEKIKFTSEPFGLIVATTPRNTPLITELTIIVHALWSGNTLVLRPSPGVAGTVALLIEGLLSSFEQDTLSRLFVIFADARKFLEIGMNYSDLIHYVGSSKYLENTLIAGIKNGVKVLVDGDGCSLVLVEKSVDVKETAKACYEGLVRCNGQICISVRAIVIEKEIYEEFSKYFLDLINNTKVGVPNTDQQPGMGPLFSGTQVEAIINVAQKYDVLSGQLKPLSFGENYITPIVIKLEEKDTKFLIESVFGPIVGLASFEGENWKRWLTENPINLTDAVFSKDDRFINEFLRTSKSPRRTVNIDPTIESVFEPWGAFLPSGWNDVSYWFHKYRNFYQLITSSK